MGWWVILIVVILMIVFGFVGEVIFGGIGILFLVFCIVGGVLLFLIVLDMLFECCIEWCEG